MNRFAAWEYVVSVTVYKIWKKFNFSEKTISLLSGIEGHFALLSSYYNATFL